MPSPYILQPRLRQTRLQPNNPYIKESLVKLLQEQVQERGLIQHRKEVGFASSLRPGWGLGFVEQRLSLTLPNPLRGQSLASESIRYWGGGFRPLGKVISQLSWLSYEVNGMKRSI